ncbi:serine O-acetyltransferase [Arthrobacter sp. Sr33]
MYAKPSEKIGGLGQDWAANKGRRHLQVLLVTFRAAQRARRSTGPLKATSPLLTLLYRSVALFTMSIDIPVSCTIGPRLAIHHGMGLVIHAQAKLGADITLRQNVTIGARKVGGDAPMLGDGVDVGVGAVILGPLSIGANARIGANAVVLHDVPDAATVVGNPGRIIERTPREVMLGE